MVITRKEYTTSESGFNLFVQKLCLAKFIFLNSWNLLENMHLYNILLGIQSLPVVLLNNDPLIYVLQIIN